MSQKRHFKETPRGADLHPRVQTYSLGGADLYPMVQTYSLGVHTNTIWVQTYTPNGADLQPRGADQHHMGADLHPMVQTYSLGVQTNTIWVQTYTLGYGAHLHPRGADLHSYRVRGASLHPRFYTCAHPFQHFRTTLRCAKIIARSSLIIHVRYRFEHMMCTEISSANKMMSRHNNYANYAQKRYKMVLNDLKFQYLFC